MKAFISGLENALTLFQERDFGPSPHFATAELISQASWGLITEQLRQASAGLVTLKLCNAAPVTDAPCSSYVTITKNAQGNFVVRAG